MYLKRTLQKLWSTPCIKPTTYMYTYVYICNVHYLFGGTKYIELSYLTKCSIKSHIYHFDL